MTANQSLNLEEEIAKFLAKGGQVQEIESNPYQPPRIRQDARETRKPPPRRPRKVAKENGLYVLTEDARALANKFKPVIKKLLDAGMKLTDIRREVGIDWKPVRVAAHEVGYRPFNQQEQYKRAMALWAPVVEEVVQGILEGVTLRATCLRLRVSEPNVLIYWGRYIENNPLTPELRKGRGCYARCSDEDMRLALQLYIELHGCGMQRAAKALGVGWHRADRLLADRKPYKPQCRPTRQL